MGSQMKKPQKLLVIEDDPGMQSQLKWGFDEYEVIISGSRTEGVVALRRHEPFVVLLDLGLPPDAENATEGLAALEEIMSLSPHTKVIVVTGNDDRANAVKAISMGAFDFYQKPIELDILSLIVSRAFHVHALERENRLLSNMARSALSGIVSSSPEMQKVCKVTEKVAPTNATILILGESGTGKELIAKALHDLSPRVNKRFVAINCAAIPENLLESELFGYEKGAFTGAAKQTIGRIEYANGGTLFLDEIGDMPPLLQTKMLRFLQERVVERIGGRGEIPVDVRVVCATHQNIEELISSGAFREDLYYRISEITVKIPALRERAGDAVLLARHFLIKYTSEMGSAVKGFTTDAVHSIEHHSWKGNVRELENRVKRAVIMADGPSITLDDLELSASEAPPALLSLRQVREKAELGALIQAMAMCDGNISQAAEMLGVSRPTLYDLLDKYQVRDSS